MHLLDHLVVELSVCWLSACHVTNLDCLLEVITSIVFHQLVCHDTTIDCLQGVCELTWSSSTFSDSDPNQWYRLIIAIFMYNGKHYV